MLRLAGDADVRGGVIRGLHRRLPDIDLVRIQDALPEGASNPEVPAWAAADSTILHFDDSGIWPIRYTETEQYRVTKAFLD